MANDALNLDAPKVPLAKLTNVLNMVVANDALNSVAPKVPLAKPTNASHMVAEPDVHFQVA